MLGKGKSKKTTRMDTLVGPQSEVTGDIKFTGGLHVEGTIKGNVMAENDGKSLVQLSESGTIEGEVSINGGDDNEQYATISYQQDADCIECADDEMVEIKSIHIMNTAEYVTELPTGSYSRVASTYDYTTQIFELEVTSGTNDHPFQDIQF